MIYIYRYKYIIILISINKDSKLCIILLAPQATLVGHHLCLPRFFQQCVALSTTMTDESVETSIIVLLGDKKNAILVCNSNKSYQNRIQADSKMFGFLTLLNEISEHIVLAIIDWSRFSHCMTFHPFSLQQKRSKWHCQSGKSHSIADSCLSFGPGSHLQEMVREKDISAAIQQEKTTSKLQPCICCQRWCVPIFSKQTHVFRALHSFCASWCS